MGRKRPSFHHINLPILESICKCNGYNVELIDEDSRQYRVYAATHVFDFWVGRMVYHRIRGEVMNSHEEYSRQLPEQLSKKNKVILEKLLATGVI